MASARALHAIQKHGKAEACNVELSSEFVDEYIQGVNRFFGPTTDAGLRRLVGVMAGSIVEANEHLEIAPTTTTFRDIVYPGEMQPDEWPKYRYLSRYSALAGNVLPQLSNGPPVHQGPTIIGDDYVMPGNWTGNLEIQRDKIFACPASQVLTNEAWDQS